MRLCAHGVSYAYPDGTLAIEGVSLCVSSGKVICVLGPNGSGKSTLLLLMAGLIRPSSGRITLDGVEIDSLEYRKICGILFQDPSDQLIAPTVEEDVALGPEQLRLGKEEVRERVRSSLERLGLLGLERKSPFRLSGGEAAKVALAGLMALDPEVYLLDEPSSSLDLRGVEVLKEVLRELKGRGKIVVIATQDSDFASEVADEVYIMNKGRLIAGGDLRILSELPLEEIGIKPPTALRICRMLFPLIKDPLVDLDSLIEVLRRTLSSQRD